MDFGGANLSVGLVAQAINAVAPVQSHTDLLVCGNEPLQLRVELDVLPGEHVAMVLESVHFGPVISVRA